MYGECPPAFTHKCKGCFNKEAQDFSYGEAFTPDVEERILKALKPDYIAGLTLLGGEPMEPENQRALLPFLRRFRECYATRKDLWIYTGCVYEDLLSQNSKWYTECTAEILKLCDVLVDGPYIESLKDISLKFRGSANRRIIKLSNLEV